jgi:EAL domain-containing protein (putative c-di-GMP-specific phosphodiesterase class I)
VAAIVAIAQQINLESVAEGVQTVAQMEFLQKLRCNFIQGYYFSKPLAVEDATKLLRYGIA